MHRNGKIDRMATKARHSKRIRDGLPGMIVGNESNDSFIQFPDNLWKREF